MIWFKITDKVKQVRYGTDTYWDRSEIENLHMYPCLTKNWDIFHDQDFVISLSMATRGCN